MRDIFFQEIRQANIDICDLCDEEQIKKGQAMLVETLRRLHYLANKVRKETILSLENVNENLFEYDNGSNLKWFIDLLLMYEEEDFFEEVGLSKYFSSNVKNYEALQILIILRGILLIHNNVNPLVLDVVLLAMVPMEVVDEYKNQCDRPYEEPKEDVDAEFVDLKKFCEGDDIVISPGEDYYEDLKRADDKICKLDKDSVRIFVDNVDHQELAIFFKGCSGRCRANILENIPETEATELAYECICIPPVRLQDVVEIGLNITKDL